MENTNLSPDEFAAAPHHKSGFVSIIGKPNAGKSTLLNLLVGEKLSIITFKAQTTRRRIFGILNSDDFQIVFSDTPGMVSAAYQLHKKMQSYISQSLEDADVLLLIIDLKGEPPEAEMLERIRKTGLPLYVLLNKADLVDEATQKDQTEYWQLAFPDAKLKTVSALNGTGTETLVAELLEHMPQHPPFYPKDQLTEHPERFFAAEIIREKIFLCYREEIPYSTEVVIDEFKDKNDITVIRATILVERTSQKGIIIGHQGKALKKVGTESRKDLEAFLGRKVFLETHVKVAEDWRNDQKWLNRLGYGES